MWLNKTHDVLVQWCEARYSRVRVGGFRRWTQASARRVCVADSPTVVCRLLFLPVCRHIRCSMGLTRSRLGHRGRLAIARRLATNVRETRQQFPLVSGRPASRWRTRFRSCKTCPHEIFSTSRTGAGVTVVTQDATSSRSGWLQCQRCLTPIQSHWKLQQGGDDPSTACVAK